MVVCICNAIGEREVRSAARAGATCPRSAYQALGRQPKCGQCFAFARCVIDSERAAA